MHAADGRRDHSAGAVSIRLELIDDMELELVIGQALDCEGLTHAARVCARSSFGEVILCGEAPPLE